MPIDPSEISTSLTLELDEEEISARHFSNAFEGFIGLLREVEKAVIQKGKGVDWLLKVYPGSAGIGVIPPSGSLTQQEVQIIGSGLINGLKEIEKGNRPPLFTDKAIEFGKKISLAFGKRPIYPKMRIWLDRQLSYTVSQKLGQEAAHFLDAAYELEGTVDGFLETIKAHNQFSFVVYDSLDQRAIACEVDEELLESAKRAFRKRVEVQGKVRYRPDGHLVSVKAHKIIPFPSPEDIPSLAEVRKLFSGK